MNTKNKDLWLFIAVILAISAFVVFTAAASAADIYVPEGEIQTIQQALNNASEGDTIIVRDVYTGTKEDINVNVAHLTIRSENGSASTIVNASDPNDHVFEVTANYVNISRFRVQNATKSTYPQTAGIYLGNGVEHCNISGNTANYNQRHGLYAASDSTNNEINSNTFCNNNQSGGNYYDIYDADSNSGDNNTCDTTYNWNDTGTTGCSWTCPSGVETSTNAGTAYFSTTNGAITDLVNISESTLPPAEKPNLKFPYGFFSFNITELTSGETII